MHGPVERPETTPAWYHGAIAAVLLVALAYRLLGLTGDMLFDPTIYAQNAYNLLQGTFTLNTGSWYAHRLPVFVPIVPLYALFGVGTATSRAWPLLLSLVQVALVIWLGRRLFDRATAVLAGALVALMPLDAVYGSVLQPDTVMAALLTAAAGCWIAGVERDARHPRAYPFLSGLCFALAVMTRENAAVLLVFYLSSLLWRRPGARTLLDAALGAGLVIVPLLAVYAVTTGDPFFRFRVVAETYGAPAMQEGGRLGFYPSLLLHLRHSVTGLGPALLALGIVGGFLRPSRSRVWLLLWALPILLHLQFGSMSVTHVLPILKRERFLAPLTAPLALLTASVLLEWTSWTARRLLPGSHAGRLRAFRSLAISMVVAALAWNSFLIVGDRRQQDAATFREFQSVVRVLARRPALPVLFDHWRTGHRFSYYLGFRDGADLYRGGDDRKRMGRIGCFRGSRLGYLCWYPDPARVPHAIIVLDDDALERVRTAGPSVGTYVRGEIPAYAYAPPATWKPLGTFGTFRVFEN
jgi:4-amino-4-deoxy-L-arabinose transferase-like glycosyltransferase